MKYMITVIIVAVVVLALDVFSEQTDQPQAPLGVEEIETTDEGYMHIDQPHPRRFDQSGESTGDIEEDKQTIWDAANRMPSVTVTSITMEEEKATIHVRVDEPMNADEREAWENNIISAVEGFIPRYKINVIVE